MITKLKRGVRGLSRGWRDVFFACALILGVIPVAAGSLVLLIVLPVWTHWAVLFWYPVIIPALVVGIDAIGQWLQDEFFDV